METYHSLPPYLKKYCVEQDYDAYTARDQAAWRFIMRQNCDFFRTHAVPVYEKGLQKTGIPIERIPRISEMDEKLRQFGWGAVAVNGFIPPAAFLEFQALGVLAIACDMRTAEHIEYTPAPDIVHEAAGHAPIITDLAYASYLRRYAKMAQKAIFAQEDIDLYEAIRYLSDIKENPDTNPAEIARAEARFQETYRSITQVSEATKVGRMAWWTVEYGLVGPMKKPLIYGAGLLSSVGESQNCLSSTVKKIPLSVECVEMGYDITKQQPQLFVANDMQQLTKVLEDLENTMSYVIGGKMGLERARLAKTVNTVIFDSGLSVSGAVAEYFLDRHGDPEFIKFSGPVQLAYQSFQLLGHGRSRHPQGFSSPMGRWDGLDDRSPHKASDEDLRRLGIVRGKIAKLKFLSGFEVEGVVGGWHRKDGNLLYITWRKCNVRRGGKIYYEPDWGEFDMVIGEKVVSVHGGPANRDDFGEYNVGQSSTKPGRSSPYTSEEYAVFTAYQKLRQIREDAQFEKNKPQHLATLESLAKDLSAKFHDEWLAALEIYELAQQKLLPQEREAAGWLKTLKSVVLDQSSALDANVKNLVEKGLALAGRQ